ncbi:leucyl aminopeptidase [Candidatus Roizmanbacteria bacterium]|nr:leucyl aminopeptidase [Candidatus Roizmanbacteria bacterium]
MIYWKKNPFPHTGNTLVFFTNENTFKKDLRLQQVDRLVKGRITRKIKEHHFEGKKDESFVVEGGDIYEYVIVYGVGESLRNSIANVNAIARTLKSTSLNLFYSPFMGKDYFELGKQIALGFQLSNYSFDVYRGKEEVKKKHLVKDLYFYSEQDLPKEFGEGVKWGQVLSDGISLTRNMVNEPASHMHPETMVAKAHAIEKASNGTISVQVLNRDECQKLGMGSYLGVAQGSDREPKFIILKYKPVILNLVQDLKKMPKQVRHDKSAKKICLVGKSITFDSGGLSLKPAKSMETMKMDMAGGATVLGIFDILAKTGKVAHEVWGVLPACENMVSGKSLRPGDIVTALNGKTIEVLNTDAEGRLALADAVAYAEKYIKPDYIIDLATLTGACMVALGEDITGIFGNDEVSVKKFIEKAKKEGEEICELPLYKPYLTFLKSDIADIKNIGGTGYGGAISGALFIGEFVKKNKWIHLDIAGPAYNSGAVKGVIGKGGTGWGILTIMSLLT